LEFSILISIFIIGLSYGATACMFSCMPFLSPLLISNSNSVKHSMGIILPFSLGRIFSYTVISIIAYFSSFTIKQFLDNNTLTNMILGIATIAMGITLLYKSYKTISSCGHNTTLVKKPTLNKLGFFTIGATMSVNPCAPIMALLGVAINSHSFYEAMLLGLFFGTGAVIFSIIFYGFILSKFIKGFLIQFSSYKIYVERFAALLLVIVGILVLNNTLKL